MLDTPEAAMMKPSNPNPKDAMGIKKWSLTVIPFRVLAGIAGALYEGARKYGRHNYRPAGVRASVYLDAAMGRHLMPWWEGQDIDPDSGKNHIDKAIAALIVLRDSMLQGNWTDDRPPAVDPKWIDDANADHVAIMKRVRPEDPVEPFTELGERLKRFGSNGDSELIMRAAT